MSLNEDFFNNQFKENLEQTLFKLGLSFSINLINEKSVCLSFYLKNKRQANLIISTDDHLIKFGIEGCYLINHDQEYNLPNYMISFFLKRNSFMKHRSWVLQPSGMGFSIDCNYRVALPSRIGHTLDVNFIAEVISELVKEVDDFYVRLMIPNFNWGDFRDIENSF